MVRKGLPLIVLLRTPLNLRDTRILIACMTNTAIKKRCSNAKETTAAQAKQEVIKQAFQD